MTNNDVPYQAAYQHLLKLLHTEKDRTVQQRLQAHLRTVTGLNQPIPLFHANRSLDDATKLEIYKVLIRALATRNFSELQGQLGVGDKRLDPIEAAQHTKEEAAPSREEP